MAEFEDSTWNKKNLNVKESSIDNLKTKIICAGKYIIVESISKIKVFSTTKNFLLQTS